MSKYIVTFRLEKASTQKAYNDRYEALNDFFVNEASKVLEDETTSTLFCEGQSLVQKLANSNILNKGDEVLFVRVDKNKKIEYIYKVMGNKIQEVEEIKNFFN